MTNLDESSRGLSRRSALGLGAAVGGAVGVGAGLSLAPSAAAQTSMLTLDVAPIGETGRVAPMPQLLGEDAGLEEFDLRGSPFYLEGLIYPGGTIAGDGFIPTTDGAIGQWFCRGHVILHPQRPNPHLVTQQEFLFGLITETDPFPGDLLTTQGLESTSDGVAVTTRVVTGGTGAYLGARGQVVQTEISISGTVFPNGDPVGNYRFDFDLRLD